MHISVSAEDIFFACAIRLNIPLENIIGIDLESDVIDGEDVNSIRVEIRSDTKLVCVGIYFSGRLEHTEWAYNLLALHEVWEKSQKTHH